MASASGEAGYVEGPRHAVVTADDVGPVITIVTLVLMVSMILAVALRLLVRFTTSRVPGSDDAVVSLALLIALGEVISTCVTVNHGLGTRRSLLSTPEWVRVEKGLFAGALLYIITIALAKASTLLLLYRLTVARRHILAVKALASITLAWTIVAIFGTAFGCNLPNSWDVSASRCFDVVAFWDAIGTVDIVLDFGLIFIPTWLVWSLQMRTSRKAFVICGFAFRALLIAAQITRLFYLNKSSAYDNGVQSTLGFILATQFETLFAVVVACVPAYQPFYKAASSGLIGISFRDRKGTYELSSINNNQGNAGGPKDQTPDRSKGSKQGSGNASRSRSKAHIFDPDGEYQAEIVAAASRAVAQNHSGSGSNGGVQKTVEWDVHYSDETRLNQAQGWQAARDSESIRPPSSPKSPVSHAML